MNFLLKDHHVRVATSDDLPIAGEIISQAFKYEPVTNWLVEKSANKDKLKITVDYLVREVYKVAYVLITDDNMGAALWKTEIKETMSWDHLKRDLDFLFKLGIPTVNRTLKDRKACKDHFPKHSPYFYLCMIGVLHEGRGKGLASQLMDPVLNHCKNNSIPAFLETGTPENVDIYKKKGFSVTDITAINDFDIHYMKFE